MFRRTFMSGIHNGQDLFDEFARVQRQMASLFGELPTGIRAVRPSAFPALNVGATDDAIEIVAFAPGMAAADFDVSIDKDLLTISGERKPVPQDAGDDLRTYAQERFHGAFRRVVEASPKSLLRPPHRKTAMWRMSAAALAADDTRCSSHAW